MTLKLINSPTGHSVSFRYENAGFKSIVDAATSLGGKPISEPRAFAGPDPSMYAFPRGATHRNIYRIHVP